MIKAPYNFVPLSDRVVFPEWSGCISHDIPFSDGLSGSITVRLTAQTPIFVRNGHSQEEAKNNTSAYQSFSVLPDGRYFLPGTTVKGAIRSVLEIMSFGKMRLDGSARFAQREWDNRHLYPLKREQLNLRCGWLQRIGDHYEIVDCGRPYRIAQTAIDDYLGEPLFRDKFSRQYGINLNNDYRLGDEKYDPKRAVFKYKLVEQVTPIERLRNLNFWNYKANHVCVSPTGNITGTIVLTGQPDSWVWPRRPRGGKFYEFVFKQPDRESRRYSLTEDEFNQYKFIYADSPDWKYANETLSPITGGVPVFFRVENNNIKDWGLAFLYKLPYTKTPFETLPDDHKSDNPDIADCIFGYTGTDASLRGRVQFTPFLSDNAQRDRSDTLALCSPKASYYPIYIEQQGRGNDGRLTGNYKTYNDGGIKGWKRYLLRRNVWSYHIERNGGNQTNEVEINTQIHPLKRGTTFEGKIRFHNLKPEELGALLSALTFHANEANCFHQFGMARPYGYGKVSVTITDIDIKSVGIVNEPVSTDPRFYMALFENYMGAKIGRSWTDERSIRELITLARNEVTNNTEFDYMRLEIGGRNEFVEAKGGSDQAGIREYLRYYSDIIGNRAIVNSLSSSFSETISSMQAQKEAANAQRERERIEREHQELERQIQEAEDALQREREKIAQERDRAIIAKIEAGLSFLNDKTVLDRNKYLIDKFSTLEKKVSDWLKIAELDKVPENQCEILADALKRLAGKPTRDEKRKKLWTNFDSRYWKYIREVTSPEFADRVFKEINP
ncbi:MAG: TIGR03986 family CRISPR-associated RAMP protein [Muribaculaceae bacterium]|nr:TIGR03986 family CRISPR-associated RAMP protein [Muribaculaceae bacterium]